MPPPGAASTTAKNPDYFRAGTFRTNELWQNHKENFMGQCQGQKKGRPRKRWLEEAENDLKAMKTTNGKTKAKDGRL